MDLLSQFHRSFPINGANVNNIRGTDQGSILEVKGSVKKFVFLVKNDSFLVRIQI